MSTFTNTSKFFELHQAGKRAALDVNIRTGHIVCRFSRNLASGGEGLGAVGEPYNSDWSRVAATDSGVITKPTK